MRIAIVAPTFNNATTLRAVLTGVAAHGLPIIVVDDGSTDATRDELERWQRETGGEVVRHEHNRGKAAAMRTGFVCARGLGFTHALTIDTDGQHDPADVPRLLAACEASPDALIVGDRPCTKDYPFRSRLGRWASNALVAFISGARVGDTQCGLRIYPLTVTAEIDARTARYAFETEILVRAAWARVPIVSVPVRCIYDVDGGRVTHFRLLRDSLAAAWMHFRLLHRSAWPWPVKKLGSGDGETGTIFFRGWRWLSPWRAWRSLRLDPRARERVGASVGWGLFVGTQVPLGYKGALCLLIAKVFRLQPLIVLATSSLSTPPVGFILWAGAIITGHVLLHGAVPEASTYDIRVLGVMPVVRNVAMEWIVGGIIFGAALGTVTWLVVSATMRLVSRRADDHALRPVDATLSTK